MLKYIDGVKFKKTKEYSVCYIEKLSDELKDIIRGRLSAICFGISKAGKGRAKYSYASTINEFIKRYDTKTTNLQKGLIGELLTHLLITEMFTEYRVVSPYFNIEERNIKKGFDAVLTTKNNVLWITEVKSGELHKGKTSDETMNDLLSLAKKDLYTRLNDNNISLWHNAINGAQIALDNNNDLKDAVIEILEDIGDKALKDSVRSNEINVFLSGILFSSFDNCICEENIKLKSTKIKNENKFKNVFILSIQKETYQKIYCFLKSEGETK